MVFDGVEYTIDTATDNALNLLNYINQYCIDNNLKDSDNNTLQFIVNITSPIWLIILGLGYMFNIFQRLLYACGLSFNISSCPDAQILNLMEIAGTEYLEGTATIVNCTVTADSVGNCSILKTDSITCLYGTESKVFHPVYDVTIPLGTTEDVIMQAAEVGPMYIPAGAFIAFDTPPANFASMTSMNSLPGTNPETTAEARTRLQAGIETVSGLDAAVTALRSLTGVQTVNLFFNTSFIDNLVISDMTIPPRCCGMIVQGYSEELANTYTDYLNVPCVGGALTQYYTTLSGQDIAVTYSLPTQVVLYIKVKVRIPDNYIVPEGYQDIIKTMLLPAGGSLLIGQDYTQKYLLTYLEDFNIDGMEIIGLELSTDNITFSDTTDLALNQVCGIAATNISFIEVV